MTQICLQSAYVSLGQKSRPVHFIKFVIGLLKIYSNILFYGVHNY